MREIEKKIVRAFIKGEQAKLDNTESTGIALYLFGYLIAYRDVHGHIFATLAGHPGPTTRSRLNALCNLLGDTSIGFYQRQGEQFFTDRSGIVNHIDSRMLVSLTHSTAFPPVNYMAA